MVSEEYAKQTGDIPSGSIFTNEMKNTLSESLEILKQNGQPIPKKIFFMNFVKYGYDPHTIGFFHRSSEDRDYIMLNTEHCYNNKLMRHTIFHESAHMADYNVNNDLNYISSAFEKGVDIWATGSSSYIEFNGKQIERKDIGNIISEYSLTNNQEFVAEVSALLTAGTIVQTKDGHYTIKTDESGHYENAKFVDCYITDDENFKIPDKADKGVVLGSKEKIDKALNDIMELYNYLTEGKVAKAKVV